MIRTTLHHYRFDLTDEAQRDAYDTLVRDTLAHIGFPVWTMRADFYGYNERKPVQDFIDKVAAIVGRQVNTHGITSGPVNLETDHLFADQWNGEELRLFNWAECVYNNKKIREGYYLTQTDEMREVLRNTMKCGYCGKQEPAAKGYTFCPHCIDNEYLKPEQLYLTRMVPVRDDHSKRRELTEAERNYLMPKYREAQLHGVTERGKARLAAAKARAVKERDRTIAKANVQHDVTMWILDRVPQALENWIYYDHTDRHCFGWRDPVSADVVSLLLDHMSEFPGNYDIKCADGRTLSN